MTVRCRPRSHLPLSLRPRARAPVVSLLCATLAAWLLTGCGWSARGGEGDPITVMTWAPVKTAATNKPGVTALAKTYARWVNSEGGINGRDLRVITCNEANDGVRAAACAKRAADEGAVAVVGSYSQHGNAFLPQLESVGLPYLGGYGITEEEFNSPLSYPVNGGEPALLAGSGRQLATECEQVSLVRPDTVAGDELPVLFNAGLFTQKRKPATDIPAPEDSADYTGAAERALDGAASVPGSTDGTTPAGTATGSCVTAALGERTGAFLDSFARLQQGRPKVGLASVSGSVQQSLVNRTGGGKGPLEGAHVTSWYPAEADPVWDPMKSVVRKHAFGDNRIDTYDPGVQTTWVAYTVLRQVLESMDGDAITRRTIQQRLDTGAPLETGGITPALGWRYDDIPGTRSYPRLVNSMVNFQQVKNGRLIATGDDPVDIASTIDQATHGS